jgi:hypothetical protein
VFNSFPFDKWSEDIADFWTWGGHNSTGTFIQLAFGLVLMVAALVAWVVMENRKLEAQAGRLRAAGFATDADTAPPGPV